MFYRIAYRYNDNIGLYFVPGEGESFTYFPNFIAVVQSTQPENEKLLKRLEEIVRQLPAKKE